VNRGARRGQIQPKAKYFQGALLKIYFRASLKSHTFVHRPSRWHRPGRMQYHCGFTQLACPTYATGCKRPADTTPSTFGFHSKVPDAGGIRYRTRRSVRSILAHISKEIDSAEKFSGVTHGRKNAIRWILRPDCNVSQ
jgi:hypothetical protein